MTLAVVDRGYKITPQGLLITKRLSPNEWRAIGSHLGEITNRVQWAIGDWLIYNGDDELRQADYAYAAKVTGRSFESLSQLARVSRAFPMPTRTVHVPWTFYREVLRVDAKERLHTLRLAASNKWTRDDLADYINGRGISVGSEGGADLPVTRADGWHRRQRNHHQYLTCPGCGLRFERRGAKQEQSHAELVHRQGSREDQTDVAVSAVGRVIAGAPAGRRDGPH